MDYYKKINYDKLSYHEQHLLHFYPYCDDENERKKIKRHSNPNNNDEIPQYYTVPYSNVKSKIQISFDEEGKSNTFTSDELIESSPFYQDNKIINEADNFCKNFGIESSTREDLNLLLIPESDNVVVAAEILGSEADQYSHSFEKIQSNNAIMYTPKLHQDINKSHYNLSMENVLKSQITDQYRAGGIIIFKKAESGEPFGKVISDVSGIHSEVTNFNQLANFGEYQFFECCNLARCSIYERSPLSLSIAKEINNKFPKGKRYKYDRSRKNIKFV